MLKRTLFQISLGVMLSGCTVTGNISRVTNNYSISEMVELRVGDFGESNRLAKDSDSNSTNMTASKKDKDASIGERPKEPTQAPKTTKAPMQRKDPKSAYCSQYEPLAVPTLVEIDEAAFNEAARHENDVAIRNMLTKNIVDINKQVRDYKRDLKKHHAAWKASCGKN